MKLATAARFAVLIGTIALSTRAQNWPSFRGANGGVGDGSPPVTWDLSKSTNVAWKTPVPGIGLSSPVIWENQIFLTTAIPLEPPRGDDFRTRHVWKLLSFERVTGRLLWETTAHEGVPFMKRHPQSSYATATAATDGKFVVALFGTDVFACFDMNGKMLWKKAIDHEGIGGPGSGYFGGSPLIVDGLAILQNDRYAKGYVSAYRLEDGFEVWNSPRHEWSGQSSPAVAWTSGASRTPLLILAGSLTFQALEARTGKIVWSLRTKRKDVAETPTVAGDLVILAAGGSSFPIYAVRAGSRGDIAQAADTESSPGLLWSSERGAPEITSPLVFQGLVYVAGGNGVLTTYDLRTGRKVYQARAGSGSFFASPVAAGDRVYLTNTDGEVTVLLAGPRFEVLGRNSMHEPTSATPAIWNGTLFIRTAGHLIALRDGAGHNR